MSRDADVVRAGRHLDRHVARAVAAVHGDVEALLLEIAAFQRQQEGRPAAPGRPQSRLNFSPAAGPVRRPHPKSPTATAAAPSALVQRRPRRTVSLRTSLARRHGSLPVRAPAGRSWGGGRRPEAPSQQAAYQSGRGPDAGFELPALRGDGPNKLCNAAKPAAEIHGNFPTICEGFFGRTAPCHDLPDRPIIPVMSETDRCTLAALNAMPADDFVAALGGVFEHSPWIAEGAAAGRPFSSIGVLHDAMCAVGSPGRPGKATAVDPRPS